MAIVVISGAPEGGRGVTSAPSKIPSPAGWFRRGHEVHRAVMVFRRPLDWAKVERDTILHRAPSVAPAATPAAAPTPERAHRAEPEVSDDPDLRLADVVRAPGKPEHEG